MIGTARVRRSDALAFGPLIAAILIVGAFVLMTALPELLREIAGPSPSPSPSPAATPTATSPMALAPIGIAIPADADCSACHLETSGVVGTRPIPVLAHPLEGWTDCTACHADDRLVQTAPGHSGLHKADCLTCHKVADPEATAPARPHHLVTGQTCVSCHGVDAPLPTDMAGRTNCWLCHPGTEFDTLFEGSPRGSMPPSQPAP